MSYDVKIEKTATGYSAHVPDLPGCVAAAETYEEAERLIREGIDFHLEGMAMREKNLVLSIPMSWPSTQKNEATRVEGEHTLTFPGGNHEKIPA